MLRWVFTNWPSPRAIWPAEPLSSLPLPCSHFDQLGLAGAFDELLNPFECGTRNLPVASKAIVEVVDEVDDVRERSRHRTCHQSMHNPILNREQIHRTHGQN